jgi:hypothetical protein
MFSGENKACLTICSTNMKRLCFVISVFSLLYPISLAAETFRVATYNVENYLDQPTESRHFVKYADARGKIHESIKVMNPDAIALEEMGTTNALLELRDSLKADGLDFPYWDHVSGVDTNIHLAALSRFPIVARGVRIRMTNFCWTGAAFASAGDLWKWRFRLRQISPLHLLPRI